MYRSDLMIIEETGETKMYVYYDYFMGAIRVQISPRLAMITLWAQAPSGRSVNLVPGDLSYRWTDLRPNMHD